jgi:hypothetical protein
MEATHSMRRVVAVVALLAGATVGASAQAPAASAAAPKAPGVSHLGLSTFVGTFTPILSLVSFKNGTDPDVRLDPASSLYGELTWALGHSLEIYGGASHVRTRVNHSSAMTFTGTDEQRMSYSPVNITSPTLGVVFAPKPGWLFVQPMLRLGGGVKFYDFQLREIANGVQDPMADVGLGILKNDAASGMSFIAEARWMPSKFDPAFLPIVLISGQPKLQNDWIFQVGLRFKR